MKKSVKWIVILAIVGCAGYLYYRTQVKGGADQGPSYDRAKAEVRDLRTIVESTGEVEPRNRLDVKPPT